jgi:preprotein translocase subunit SecE
MIKKIKDYINEIVVEMKKVSWPTKQQLRESTTVVVATTAVITAIVWVIDQIMTFIVNIIFS